MSKIRTIDLTKKYDDFVANDRINLTVEEGEIKCIVGENGAGKTTLMNMLYGVHKPTSGKLLVDDKEVVFHSPQDAMRHGIGMVHQHFKLVPSLTVYENIFLGTEILKKGTPFIDRKTEIQKVRELIEKYHFQIDPNDLVMNTSVGQRQQIEILKMLYRNVDTLILDEPTSVLTPQEVDRLIDNLRELRDSGKTIIVITHKLREVMALSDTVTVIKAGKVVGEVKTSETNEKELAQMMVGRDVVLTVSNDGSGEIEDKPLYEVENLTTINEYGKTVVDHVSFSVRRGEVLGIAGVEGNGQSELVKVLSGIYLATDGSVRIGGEDITNAYPAVLRKKHIGIVPEDRYAEGLCRDMSLADNCIAGYHTDPEISRFGLIRSSTAMRRTREYIKKYDIRIVDERGNVSQLSGGNAQKIIIAREFESNPSLIIASQPTRGVDVGSIEFIHKSLLDFRNRGGAVLLISSELSEVMSLSDRVIVMYKGAIIGEVDPRKVSREDIGLLMAGAKPKGDEVHG
ncbi:MAG: ABC transporter ATP-binding protein [Oscillospiraceae bacterium]|nr:ABC transporter ATP-binding protein [Oscillospiraceae bacterium]